MALQTFKIDQEGTFSNLIFLQAEPKTSFGSDQQETTKDGVLKWVVQVLGAFRDQFGQVNNEVLKITVNHAKNPGDGVAPYMPVQLIDLELGVMADTKKDRATGQETVLGARVYYRANGIRPNSGVSSNSSGSKSKAEAA